MENNLSKSWKESLLSPGATIREAIKNMDKSCLQIILCVDKSTCLIGTLTDGDIRRGLLKGYNMDTPIEAIIHKRPIVVPANLPRETALELMRGNRLHQLPIVDENRKVMGLHLWEELFSTAERENIIVIMAGGKGTRLLPLTENCPKPMLEIHGKPMLEHIILKAKSDGFKNFVISLHYCGEMIESYFGDGSSWDINIEYVKEVEPLGTAGALSLLSAKPNVPFIVTNGDVLCEVRYSEMVDFHERNDAKATMAVRHHEWQHPFGVVKIKGVDIIGFEEKPITRSHINAGVYVLEPSSLSLLEPGKRYDMPALFTKLQNNGMRTIVYPMHEPWLDVGRPADLDKARKNIRKE
ncbi:nucleotidyl transferase [Halobacteriovorax marinus]|mgnify:CR=1 FL=1|uniref:Nucleotidyl transferase n=1 Tax=Halobacteriovorax marinus TaxID=97084 RepID=A0A1Y5FB34_9BACT|nr:nucleotidyl transferase [Halobacteriovorax marinus]